MTDEEVLAGTVPMETLFPHVKDIRGIPVGFLDEEQKDKARARIQHLESKLVYLHSDAVEADTAYTEALDKYGKHDRLTITYRLDAHNKQQLYHEARFEITQLNTLIARSLGVRRLK